jgi:hypothetical protein
MFVLQVLGGAFVVLIFAAIISWIICMAFDIGRSKSEIEVLDARVTRLESALINQLKCNKDKLEAEKKIAICKLKKK